MRPKRTGSKNLLRLYEPSYLKRLIAAGTRAASLGIAVLDSQTRFESVNAALTRETRLSAEYHLGKTPREVTGDFARQIEPTYEEVFRTGKAKSVVLTGHIRDTPEFGYWLDHCFPIVDGSGRVRQLGVFVINVTAENATTEIFNALATDPKLLMAESAGLLEDFDESIRRYHEYLRVTLEELGSPSAEAARNTDRFRASVQQLDEEIHGMRELIYAVVSQFSIPAC
ncbi:MAG: domain S-box [Acidobacteriaceae bacterium]|nr:domain S-box [Acidobacteriaceae bacterium]